jgi:hypothetical protein
MVIATTGCDDDADIDADDDVFDETDTNNTDDIPPVPSGVYQWHANIDGNLGFEVLDGGTIIRQNAGGTVFLVDIDLRGDIAGSVRPWHVHFGDCDSGGGIVGDPALYRPLIIGADGEASVTARVEFALDPDDDYHVNVHLSETDLGTLIACGDLDLNPL